MSITETNEGRRKPQKVTDITPGTFKKNITSLPPNKRPVSHRDRLPGGWNIARDKK